MRAHNSICSRDPLLTTRTLAPSIPGKGEKRSRSAYFTLVCFPDTRKYIYVEIYSSLFGPMHLCCSLFPTKHFTAFIYDIIRCTLLYWCYCVCVWYTTDKWLFTNAIARDHPLVHSHLFIRVLHAHDTTRWVRIKEKTFLSERIISMAAYNIYEYTCIQHINH
jgi:hypothetical protein